VGAEKNMKGKERQQLSVERALDMIWGSEALFCGTLEQTYMG
jgi:hypothetical protein